jgi:ABC-type phosphate/phosphonate transport system substrate-binding protein
MINLLAFPMYAVNRADNEALTFAVRGLLAEHGVPVSHLNASGLGDDLLSHWRHPDLLLSQTCGFPLMTQLPDVQTVGCFHYTAPGCNGIHYRSFLVARATDKHPTLADFQGKRVACNARDSQSGYNVLLKMVASLDHDAPFFERVVISGSHRQSLIEIKRGAADIAAIDCITWALLQRHEPDLIEGLTVIGESPLAPGLPLIAAQNTSHDTLSRIRAALNDLVSAAKYRQICDDMFIGAFSEVTRQPYSLLLDWRDAAARKGVTQL